MDYSDLRGLLIPSVLVLLGIVMLLAGRGGGRLGGRIALVIGGAIVLFFLFYVVVDITLGS